MIRSRLFLRAHAAVLVSALGLFVAAASAGACGSDAVDAGDAGAPRGGSSTFPVTDPGKNGVLVTVSGENLAVEGYEFTAASLAEGDPPAFVDGWELRFEHVIVTLDHVRLSADPDADPGAPDKVGATVAEASGPFAVDVTLGGNITGKSGEPDERTVAIAAFTDTKTGAFDPQKRYAFGYDTVAAAKGATLVNLDDAGKALYEEAIAKGYSMILRGIATYRGPAPEPGSVFAKIPKRVRFSLGLENPSSYQNCQNTDLAANGDEFPRGIQTNEDRSTVAQITIHTDHIFWDKLNVEGTPLHFDPIAANASGYGDAESEGNVTSADLESVDVTAFRTKTGEVLPARSVVSDYKAPPGQLRYDPNGTTFAKANSFASFLSFSAASGGHLNSDGECEIKTRFVP